MTYFHFRCLPATLLGFAGLALAACAGSFPGASPPPAPAVSAAPPPPPSLRPEDIIGRWGYSAYHRPEDRPRTETAARNQCTQPYIINRSSIGVSMLGHDSPRVQDMTIKGSYDGKTYIGPGAEPSGPDDREVLSFDGRVLVLNWVDPDVAGRYGTMVLVRCGAEGTNRPARAAR
jgi:hypothetical protein